MNPKVEELVEGDELHGIISTIVRDRGFGFIRAKGHEIFFHESGVRDGKFMELQAGDRVGFTVVLADKNGELLWRAVGVDHDRGADRARRRDAGVDARPDSEHAARSGLAGFQDVKSTR